MLYRRGAGLVDALRFDGSEHSAREISRMPGLTVAMRNGEIEIATSFGRKLCRTGQWATVHRATGAARVFNHDDFLVEHEVVR